MNENRIASERIRNNWTQEELANKIGISRKTLRGYEKGIYPIPSNLLVKLVCLFQVSADYLIGLENLNSINIQK